MRTGRQIREARKLLVVKRIILAQKVARIATRVVVRAAEIEDEP